MYWITFTQKYAETFIYYRMHWDMTIGFQPYGQWWRKHRKSFQDYFHPNQMSKYKPILRQEVQAFLRRLLVTPDNFFHHIRQ